MKRGRERKPTPLLTCPALTGDMYCMIFKRQTNYSPTALVIFPFLGFSILFWTILNKYLFYKVSR